MDVLRNICQKIINLHFYQNATKKDSDLFGYRRYYSDSCG